MIHATAVIDKEAVLEEGVDVGPYAVIEKGVSLGKRVKVLPFSHIKGNTRIGENTFVGSGALIGEMPQLLGCKENQGKVFIGKNNVIREYVTIHASTSIDNSTYIGDNNYLMGFSHIAHDCHLGNNIVICNGALLAGHIHVENGAFMSGNAVIHQFARIGRLAMIAGLARVNQDVPPFMMVVGDSRVWGVNLLGLRRAGLGREEIKGIKKAFNILYRQNLPVKGALKKMEEIRTEKVKEIVNFIRLSKRGICGPKRSTFRERIFLDYPYFLRSKIPAYSLFLKTRTKK